ncbi:hypothetical protein AOQ73_05655 [Bradyrhizobium pachyrhizi]|uniref:hypothetical protein n=1 Tax=Bradyrhizobium pachyrhizi TaxID=280333 RepID=UPI00070504B0|nr:hypothetical protein [Bradyrhizobium pachyrhizi]KRQ11892.1 hypothetical protein AOQ73_05655 [Bradyrhizobium pachyrhizi]
MMVQTTDQYRRTVAPLAETESLIAKEMRYSPQHRSEAYLARLEQHATKLSAMIRDASRD